MAVGISFSMAIISVKVVKNFGGFHKNVLRNRGVSIFVNGDTRCCVGTIDHHNSVSNSTFLKGIINLYGDIHKFTSLFCLNFKSNHKAARGPQPNRAAALVNEQKNFLKKDVFTV
jgi:hypothetical protein